MNMLDKFQAMINRCYTVFFNFPCEIPRVGYIVF